MSDANEDMKAAYHHYRLKTDRWYAFCNFWIWVGVEMIPDDR